MSINLECWYLEMFCECEASASLFAFCTLCTQSCPITLPAFILFFFNQELGNNRAHSCRTQVRKNTGCIIFPPETIPLNLSPAEAECALFISPLPCFLSETRLTACRTFVKSLQHKADVVQIEAFSWEEEGFVEESFSCKTWDQMVICILY